MTLRILNVSVGRLGPFKLLEQTFDDKVNCLIGPNGCGKSTLLQVIAGVCGTDDATALIANQPVEFCEVVVDHDNVEHVFTVTERFDLDAILDFKFKLETRASFPLTQYHQNFVGECVEMATVRSRFKRYCKANDVEPRFIYEPSQRRAFFTGGDGVESAFSLFLHDSPAGVPLLLDGPERHQHIIGQTVLLEALTTEDRQLIYATHSPEMLPATDKIIDLSNK